MTKIQLVITIALFFCVVGAIIAGARLKQRWRRQEERERLQFKAEMEEYLREEKNIRPCGMRTRN